ncbi:hypothetical protein SmJEL517_g00532 [Synchytrium microbalum]|uniref:CHY-type domain-containing protein n=1 Tax=Synchytrium microbalum TaxID=1806994 RepID=A0A507CIX3_9FUNG|nr:uncharacterized protein SmJEL517_g00532 [Synchytrium microbalum]TPX37705.1 hypothetical protein SmJEL517_g00532 [Synchytrium microbalum]
MASEIKEKQLASGIKISITKRLPNPSSTVPDATANVQPSTQSKARQPKSFPLPKAPTKSQSSVNPSAVSVSEPVVAASSNTVAPNGAATPSTSTLAVPAARSLRPVVARTPVARPTNIGLAQKLESAETPLEKAALIRDVEMVQLQKRFPKGITDTERFTFSMAPSDPDFPFDLESIDLALNIPRTYPITPATLVVNSTIIPQHLIKAVSLGWNRKASVSTSMQDKNRLTLLQLVNWLDVNLERLLIGREEPAPKLIVVNHKSRQADVVDDGLTTTTDIDNVASQGTESSDSQSESSSDSQTEDGDGTGEQSTANEEGQITGTAHRGTQIRFILPTLTNIALLRTSTIQLLTTCHKCHIQIPITINSTQFNQDVWWTCNRCSSDVGCRLRPTYCFAGESNLGYIDLHDIGVSDVLTSTYIATCGTCDSTIVFKNQTRGGLVTHTCEQCHSKLTLGIDEVKFVKLQAAVLSKTSASSVLPQKKKKRVKDDVNLVVGEPLPKTGNCSHYKHSHRWFRFACCGRLYPCDLCHEEQNPDGHEMVFGSRMVCGYCSREQRVGNECVCGKSVTRIRGTGHWEGGQGTRDRTLMSRNESRKFAGLSKTTSRKSRK